MIGRPWVFILGALGKEWVQEMLPIIPGRTEKNILDMQKWIVDIIY
ncbi:hypothetical protein [Criblamydia sequanensis]|uniref:Uncharacterized protein n=1 Tax=Candidatus Criblamydia sequanensis CRIB-18 TaxID=1437425 RepID=A0A090D0P3_9BACT|nr:hypothetical protein [Criblamydia sequanensis]CDR34891.1 hypothetical protein CSEC_2085 [Criblamydia sequanensis CRIB-18]